MTISIWSKRKYLGLSVALVLMGQSCSISLGGSYVDGGVFRSDDHGTTWRQANAVSTTGKQQLNLNDVTGRVLVFAPDDHRHLYLGTLANGIWTSADRGDHWVPTALRSGAYDCIEFDPLNAQVMYTSSGSLILKSIDSGLHWTTVYTEPQPNNAVNCLLVNPSNGQEVYATTSGGKILRSTDYGNTWTLMYTFPTGMEPRRLYMAKEPNAKLYIFTRANGIFRGEHRGDQWTDMTEALTNFPAAKDIRQVTIVNNRWYLATSYGLLTSSNRGVSWTSIPVVVNNASVPIQDVAVNPLNTNEVFITTNQQIHHSTDGGRSWSVRTLPTSRLPVLLTFDPVQPDYLYFATFKQQK